MTKNRKNHTCGFLHAATASLAALSLNAYANESDPLPEGPTLLPKSFESGEGFRLDVDGLPGVYGIQYSDDLSQWNPFSEIVLTDEPVSLADPETLEKSSRFYRIEQVSLFPQYHTLLSSWALQASPGVSSFLMGFMQLEGLFVDPEREQVIVWQPADAFARTSVHSDGSVEVSANYGLHPSRSTAPAGFADGGLVIQVPEEEDGDHTYHAWDLPMNPLGAFDPENGLAGMLTGTTIRTADLDGGSGERFEFIQAFLARKSVDAGIGDLVGDWGIVRLEIESDFEENLYTVLSVPVNITDENGGTLNVTGTEIETEMIHFFDGSDPVRRYFEEVEADFSFPFAVSPTGEVLLSVEGFGRPGQDTQPLAGFMSPSADFLVMAEGWPNIYDVREGDVPEDAGEGFAAHQLFLAVRRDLNPDLAGRQYRLEGQSFWVSRWDFEMLPSGADGVAGSLSFDQNGEATLTLEDLIVFLPFYDGDQDGITVETDDPDEIPLSYSVAADGRLNFDMSDITDPGEEAFFTGFVQEGGRVLILALGFAGEDGEGGDEGQISMWVATCVNCD